MADFLNSEAEESDGEQLDVRILEESRNQRIPISIKLLRIQKPKSVSVNQWSSFKSFMIVLFVFHQIRNSSTR